MVVWERKCFIGCMKKVRYGGRWEKENMISREVKRESYERVVIPTWSLSAQERIKTEVFEICLGKIP